MRKRQNRISVWLVISIILLGVVIYLYLKPSQVSPGDIDLESAIKPQALIYLNPASGNNQIISHNLTTGKEITLLDNFGELLSLNSCSDRGVALILVKKDQQITLMTLGLLNGAQTELGNVTSFNPKVAYEYPNSRYLLITGDHSDQILFIDSNMEKISEIKPSGEISSVSVQSDDKIELAIFNGNNSDIQSYSGKNGFKSIAKIDGRAYKINDGKILYAKKMTSDIDESNPTGKTFWKISLKDLAADTDTILSEGNFDQNAISDPNFQIISYQKKYDTSDQADGRIFIINTDNKIDRISSGVPLIYSY